MLSSRALATNGRKTVRHAQGTGSPPRDLPLIMLYPLFFVAVFLSHWTLLRLPYFWDEGGYYIPAAYDLFRTGTLIPHSTLTNAHPPVPSILLAGWWHLSGFVISGTRTLVCLVAAAALLGIYRLGSRLAGPVVGALVAFLTAIYPIWYAQSTLAHADIFAAAFTGWALSFYLPSRCGSVEPGTSEVSAVDLASVAILSSLSALSKETAVVTPLSLAVVEAISAWRNRRRPIEARAAWLWTAALAAPVFPLLAWYAYHWLRTGYVFGNPEYLRYNATANFTFARTGVALWHRFLHLTGHMNFFVATLSTLAGFLMPERPSTLGRKLPRRAVERIAFIVGVNWVEFSVLGGALLTRYLLPMYPLLLLVAVSTWLTRMRWWPVVVALCAAAFFAAIWINPPYAFAPEDNLTYRDMIIVHLEAAHRIERQFPEATVLTAWPATAELQRPELGYVQHPIKVVGIPDFSPSHVAQAAAEFNSFDTALLFSTKWEPASAINLSRIHEPSDTRFFDFHHDLRPSEAASALHGEVAWHDDRGQEWAGILRFEHR